MEPGRVAVVTGASGGIGAGVARALGGAGWRLGLAARRADELAAVAADCGEAVAVPTDVTDRAQVERLGDTVIERFGRIDLWINNAGVGIVRPALELTDADLDRMFAINTRAALYGMQAAIRHFRARGRGQVINVSSVLGRAPVAPARAAYSAAKAAMDSLTRSVRADLAAEFPEIHVSLLIPGVVATEFEANAAASSGAAAPRLSGAVAVQPVSAVVEAMLDLIANPRPERYTNPASPAFVRAWLERQGALG